MNYRNGVNKMQDKTGGYCPRCDTVWASPGKCRCETNKEYDKIFAEQPYSKDYAEGWNDAIEAAANEAINIRLVGVHFVAEQIRKLKK